MFTRVLGVMNISKACITGHMMDLTSFCRTKLVCSLQIMEINTKDNKVKETLSIEGIYTQNNHKYDLFRKLLHHIS